MKLQARFLLLLGLLSLLSMTLFGYLNQEEIHRIQAKEVNDRIQNHQSLALDFINEILVNAEANLDLISKNSLTRRYFSTNEHIRYQLFHTELIKTLQQYYQYNEYYSEIAVILPDGFKDIFILDLDINDIDLDFDYSVITLTSKALVNRNHVYYLLEYQNNNPILSVYRPIMKIPSRLKTHYNMIVGYIKISININQLARETSTINVLSAIQYQDKLFFDKTMASDMGMGMDISPDDLDQDTRANEILPHITLYSIPNTIAIKAEIKQAFRNTMVLIIGASVSLVLVSAVLLRFAIIRPLYRFADLVNNTDIATHNRARLKAYEKNEFKLLTHNFDQLISRIRTSANDLHRQALTDTLTNLPNRAALYRLLDSNTQLQNQDISVMFLDLDGFKQVNDNYGHDIGDLLLIEVAKRLKSVIRKQKNSQIDHLNIRHDAVFRLGGDEFTIVLLNSKNVELVADRIIHTFQAGFEQQGKMIYTGTSIGIANYPKDTTDRTLLIQYADLAMYQAKKQGKMRYCRFTPTMAEDEMNRLKIEENVRGGIEFNRFETWFQPKINSETNELIGFESLARLRDVNGNMISPSDFIPIAQEDGVLEYITYFVCEHTCQLLEILNDNNMVASFNITPSQLNDMRLIADIRSIMWRYNIQPNQIEFEIKESELITHSNSTCSCLTLLRSFGFRTALDNFGTGYSSLGHLKKFQFDTLKLDQMFINAEDYNSEASADIISSIKSLTDRLGVEITAKGIENIEQIQFLNRFGVVNIQGHYYAAASPKDKMIAYVKNLEENRSNKNTQ